MANGAIVYRGPSMLDGAEIAVIITGLESGSTNRKTGELVQSYILRTDVHPVQAVRTGADASICGTCVHRGNGDGTGRTCYVEVGKGAGAVYGALTRGSYPVSLDPAELTRGRIVRLGTYGDPAAVPFSVWERVTAGATAWTGYTHAWRTVGAGLQRFCMASVDSLDEMHEAHAAGWRTFRVMQSAADSRVRRIEAVCPASAEAGKKLTCEVCRACDGNGSGRAGSIVIRAHGGAAVMANVRRRVAAAA